MMKLTVEELNPLLYSLLCKPLKPDMDSPTFDSGISGHEYEFINLDESLNLVDCRHAAHCCIYSPHSFPTVKSYESKAYIMMQLRFDGRIGFPGGIVKPNESTSIMDELNRELLEEVNLDEKYFITRENYYFTHFSKKTNSCFHFFAKEVSVKDFLAIEKNNLKAEDYGQEVLGLIKVPLVVVKNNLHGFPAFLKNNFAGCARDQLLHFLLRVNLMSYDEIKECLSLKS